MGHLQAQEMKDRLSFDQALSWHLQSNHYPPVPLSMLSVCKEAIEHANVGDWDILVKLPNGVLYKGRNCAPVSEIVRAHHLNDFLADDGFSEIE